MNTKIIVALVIGIALVGLIGTASAEAEHVFIDEMGDEYWCGYQPMYPGEMAFYGLEWAPADDYSVISLYFPYGGWVKANMEISESIRYTRIQFIGDEVLRMWNNCASGPQGTTTWGYGTYYWQGT